MRDTYNYTAQKIADKYGISKVTISEYWSIAELPLVRTCEQIGSKHLYEISKLVNKKEWMSWWK